MNKQKIAFQGISAAHTDLACREAYPDMVTMPCHTFEEVFAAVQTGAAALGMIPIENSHAGRVAEIHNLWLEAEVFIVAEHFQPIAHHLFALPGSDPADITDVYSHPQALMQCRSNLNELGLKCHHHADTALAARDVAAWGDPTRAALCAALAGDLYQLERVRSDLQDSRDNTTVFVTISRRPVDPDPADGMVITSLLFSVRNIPAALYKALGGFATNHVNLVKLESYIPVGVSQATAKFFVTLEGHTRDRAIQLALDELEYFCDTVDIIGTYHAAPQRFHPPTEMP